MPTVQVEANLSFDDLLQAAQQLSEPELEKFVGQVVALQAQRKAPSLSQSETELLLKINQGIPHHLQLRYDELIIRRRAEILTPEEQRELLELTAQVEAIEAKRIEDMAELARLRRTTLPSLMKELGIQPPVYA